MQNMDNIPEDSHGSLTSKKRVTANHLKATVQPPSHAKHSRVLCKGCSDIDHQEGLHHQSPLKTHKDPKLCFIHFNIS